MGRLTSFHMAILQDLNVSRTTARDHAGWCFKDINKINLIKIRLTFELPIWRRWTFVRAIVGSKTLGSDELNDDSYGSKFLYRGNILGTLVRQVIIGRCGGGGGSWWSRRWFMCSCAMHKVIGDNCSLAKVSRCIWESHLIAAVTDLVGNSGKKAAGISWIRHTSEKVCNWIDGFIYW